MVKTTTPSPKPPPLLRLSRGIVKESKRKQLENRLLLIRRLKKKVEKLEEIKSTQPDIIEIDSSIFSVLSPFPSSLIEEEKVEKVEKEEE